MLDVCLLGTSGMLPLPGRWLTSLMTRYNGSSLMIDCGEACHWFPVNIHQALIAPPSVIIHQYILCSLLFHTIILDIITASSTGFS
jgi:hypothetical protein